jgi:hypothetical protein
MLCLLESGSYFDPTLVRRQPDAVALDAALQAPRPNGLYCLVARSEHLEDITRRPGQSAAEGVCWYHVCASPSNLQGRGCASHGGCKERARVLQRRGNRD